MNEIKISNAHTNPVVIVLFVLLIGVVCAGILYYYRGADRELERELGSIEQLNKELASETRQLQAGIASHSAGIRDVGSSISESRKRVEHVYTDLEKAGGEADRAIRIVEECQNIIKAIKAQR